jgi:hypothetical protein
MTGKGASLLTGGGPGVAARDQGKEIPESGQI